MMNILSAKQQSINNDMLQTSLQRDIEYALGKKPSLDGLSDIQNTPVNGPFLGVNNLKLGSDDVKVEHIMKQNRLVDGQIANLQNQVLNSSNVARVMEMKYENKNGVRNGTIRNMEINSVRNNNNQGNQLLVKEEVVDIPTEEKLVNSFTIDLDDIEDSNSAPSATWELNTPSSSLVLETNNTGKVNNLKVNDLGEEIYHGVKSVQPRNNNLVRDNSWEKSFQEMLGKMRTNKIMIVLFLVIVLVIVFLIKGKK